MPVPASSRHVIRSAFTDVFKTHLPLCIPPMKDISGPRHVAAAVNCGTLAFLGENGYGENVRQQQKRLQEAQQLALMKLNERKQPTNEGSFLDHQVGVLQRLGVGHVVEGPQSKKVISDDTFLSSLIDKRPGNIWLTFTSSDNIAPTIDNLRKRMLKSHLLISIFAEVTNANDALLAANAGADVLVLRDNRSESLESSRERLKDLYTSTNKLLHEKHFGHSSQGLSRPLLLAAGKLRTGEDLMWSLHEGYDGAAIGSRFFLTEESGLSDDIKSEEGKKPLAHGMHTEMEREGQDVQAIIDDIWNEALGNTSGKNERSTRQAGYE